MHRGLEVGIHLTPGVPEEGFVAMALGNLAAAALRDRRAEPLEWQVLRVEGSTSHHFRLVIRHPERILDLGIKHDLAGILKDLSDESVDQLRERYEAARRAGLQPVPLRTVKEDVDFWQDPFWTALGGGPPGPIL